jgi:hypothetical protein
MGHAAQKAVEGLERHNARLNTSLKMPLRPC